MNKHFRVSGTTFSKLEESGVPASAVLRRAGLPQGFIHQPRVLLKTEELFALWRAIEEVSTNPAIGLQLGTETKTERFHPVSLAALSTENFGTAVEQMARYKQLTCPEEILQTKDSDEWRIQFHWLLADEVEPPVLIECCFAWVLSVARHGTGTRISPLRVELVQPRAHVKTIERHFGCPVLSGAPQNAIVFRAADAERPFVTRNAELLAMLAPQFEEELRQESKDENFLERVRIAIQQKLVG
jgi:AraC-type transcriptional regulator